MVEHGLLIYISRPWVEDNERISKWTHLFKLSQPFSRYRSSKLRFMMKNSAKIRLFSQQISR